MDEESIPGAFGTDQDFHLLCPEVRCREDWPPSLLYRLVQLIYWSVVTHVGEARDGLPVMVSVRENVHWS